MSDIEDYKYTRHRRSSGQRSLRSRSRDHHESDSSYNSRSHSRKRHSRRRHHRSDRRRSYSSRRDLRDRQENSKDTLVDLVNNEKPIDNKSDNASQKSQESTTTKKKRTGWDSGTGIVPNPALLLNPTATGFTADLTDKSSEETACLAASLQFKLQATQLCRIYVGSLDYSLTDQDIRQVFSAFGPIISVDMPKEGSRSKGFCFIEYATPEAAQMAITTMPGFNLKGRIIKVGRPTALGGGLSGIPTMGVAKTGVVNAAEAGQLAAAMFLAKSENTNYSSPEPLNHIYVGSVPSTFTSEDIKQIFDVFGKIISCQLVPSAENPSAHRGYGFIEYSTVEEAKLAIETMNDFAIAGKILKVVHTAAVRGLQGITIPAPGNYSQLLMGGPLALTAPPIPPDQIPSLPDDINNLSILLLSDMVDPTEANSDLKEEIRQECMKYGDIYDIAIISDALKKAVRIFVIFNNTKSAEVAVPMLHDRWFGGRRINARTYEPAKYQAKEYWI